MIGKLILTTINRFVNNIILGRVRNNLVYKNDFVRNSSLELVAYEIIEKNILGCVAELGVFKGEFARLINTLFPGRTLYLFDTFEGFDHRDVKIEIENGFSAAKKQDYYNSSVELVMDKMKYPESCIVKKGYFPETVTGVEEKFVFVSIDVDLYEPIYNGLLFFYPRLQPGGYIFVHDYNNIGFGGAKAAVQKFAKEFNVSYFPLTDGCGTAVFVK
jgi:O-methyltransferase